MKKLLCLLLSLLLFSAPSAQVLDFGNIDTIMEDNALSDTANRYSAVQLSFFPEYATRLGFESANDRLDVRTEERDAQAQRALTIVQEGMQQLNRKNLSEPRKTEYDMLQRFILMDLYDTKRHRTARDPLLYSQVFPALFDLRIKNVKNREVQDRDLTDRLARLPQTAQQAKMNLTTPPSFLSQLAMEDAYYAYLAFDEIPQYLLPRAKDDVSRAQLRSDAKNAKNAIKELFDLFKKSAQENTERDFRLGEKDYEFVLQNRYFIDDKSRAVAKTLMANFQAAQQNLLRVLDLFAVPEVELQEEVVSETIRVPGEADAETAEQPAPQKPAKPAKQKNKKKKNKNTPIVTAEDFYAAAKTFAKPVIEQDFVAALSHEVSNLTKFYAQDRSLPTAEVSPKVLQMPAYYAYSRAYLFMPPFGTQTAPSYDLLLRVPSGNALTKQEMLNRDFNAPTLKLLLAGQLVPGLAYRAAYGGPRQSAFRKMYSVPTLRNGWEVYAQQLAHERGFIIMDEEMLFLAWADYVRAAQALVDYYLHTRQFTYSEALSWLTEKHGFEQTTAQNMLKSVAAQPGEAVSYIYGYNAIKNLRAKYQKKLGKKFSLADFHAKLLAIGNIPPDRLEAEMEYAYLLEKSNVAQALNSPFYMN